MAQRLTTDRQLYYGEEGETTEGQEVAGSNDTFITLTNLAVSPDVAFNSRSVLGQQGRIKGVMGGQVDPGLSFTVQCRGGGTVVTPKLDKILKRVLAPGTLDTGSTTVENQSPSEKRVINVVSAANFSIGNAVAIETSTANVYEVGWIADRYTHVTEQDTITLTHDLKLPPANGANVKPSMTYRPQNTGHGHLSFQLWLDATRKLSFRGCKGSMKFDAPAPGAVPTMTFNFSAMSWAQTDGSRPTAPVEDTADSPTSYLFKIDSTEFDAKLASWDLRQVIARKRSQNSSTGIISQLVTNRDLMGVIHAYDMDDSQFDDWSAGDEQAIAHQFGSTLYNIVAYQIPKAQRRRVSYGDDTGLTTDRVAFQGNITNGADEVRLAFL